MEKAKGQQGHSICKRKQRYACFIDFICTDSHVQCLALDYFPDFHVKFFYAPLTFTLIFLASACIDYNDHDDGDDDDACASAMCVSK